MYGYPQALFTAEQAWRTRFLLLGNDTGFLDMAVCVNSCEYVVFFLLYHQVGTKCKDMLNGSLFGS